MVACDGALLLITNVVIFSRIVACAGKVEIRAKIPQGQGIWPAIWMLPTDEKFGTWPRSGEIDIMENIGSEPKVVHATTHYGRAYNDKSQITSSYSLPKDQPFSDSFHVYSVERVEDKVEYFVDGVRVSTATKAEVEAKGFQYPFNERFYVVLNVAVGGQWPGNPDDTTTFPKRMEVDYVRVFQNE